MAASDSNRVDIIDVATLKVVDRVDVGPDPEVFDLSPDGKTMYVGNEDDAELSFFDMATRKKVGSVKVDDAYLKKSMVEPNAQVVAGFAPIMPPSGLSEAEMAAVIAFIKEQK